MKKEKKTQKEKEAKKLKEKLFFETKSVWSQLNEKEKKELNKLSEEYKEFLNNAKTEREAVQEIKKELEKSGFKNLENINKIKSGEKVYKTYKEKEIIAMTVGEDTKKIKMIVSHIDSPRLDLKLKPIYEDSGICLMKTNYYGGIKKYQWVNIPLAIHGVIIKSDGKKIIMNYGEKKDEPVMIIPDLLPHLASKQMEKKMKEGIEGEDLNIIIGNIPYDEKIEQSIKLNILNILNKKYGITEKDFVSAELEIVPEMKARDVGFDKSMIAGYGQDDKICTFSIMKAIQKIKKGKKTAMAFFTDKEEIGSVGNTSIRGVAIESFIDEYIKKAKINTTTAEIFRKMEGLSADVDGGLNPNFKSVQDLKNVAMLGHGIVINKYTGSGGKGYTNDANAEYAKKIIDLFDKKEVRWQIGALGKVDEGGGGTVSMFIANRGAEIIDVGPVVLSMHSPYEITSKADLYETYKAYKIFLE